MKQPSVIDKNFFYFCITDSEEHDFGIWSPIVIDRNYRDSRRTSRIFKTMPHLLFGNAAITIYVDASIRISGDMSDFSKKQLGPRGISLFRHPSRDCIYQEAAACISRGKDVPAVIESQIARYRQLGYPEKNGLIAGSIILRHGRNPLAERLGRLWMEEIGSSSLRDQISFNYVSWTNGIDFDFIDLDIQDNKYFELLPHSNLSSSKKLSILYILSMGRYLMSVSKLRLSRLVKRIALR